MTNKLKFLKSKLLMFIVQLTIVSLFVYIYNGQFSINFDRDITPERKIVIQGLGNLVLYNSDNLSGSLFIFLLWIFVSLIPVLVYKNYKKAYSTNLRAYLFPTFFFYVFLSRYSPIYFKSNIYDLLIITFVLTALIILFSIGTSLVIKRLIRSKNLPRMEDLSRLENENKINCPQCGIAFDSIPKYCYNCSKELTVERKSEQ